MNDRQGKAVGQSGTWNHKADLVKNDIEPQRAGWRFSVHVHVHAVINSATGKARVPRDIPPMPLRGAHPPDLHSGLIGRESCYSLP